MQQGAELDLFAFFVSRSFELKRYGAIYGAILMAGARSTAVALVLFGEVHDATGSYDIALKFGAVPFCVGALAFAAIGRTGTPPSSGAFTCDDGGGDLKGLNGGVRPPGE